MSAQDVEADVTDAVLKKYGMKWAVLGAMRVDMVKKGVELPDEVDEDLDLALLKIRSGCFSTCEVGCSLARVEAHLMSSGYTLGEDYFRQWFKLLGQAMGGEINPKDIEEIPALQPVVSDCKFLGCRCSEDKTARLPPQESLPPSNC